MRANNLKWIYLIVLSLIWGSSFILIKKGLVGLTPIQLGAIRVIFTGIFLLIVGFNKIKSIKSEDWKWVTLTGFLGTFFPAFLFAFAETEIDSSIASILNSLVPLNTIILGAFVFKIGSTKRQVLGVLIGLLGAILLIMNGASVNTNQNYLYVSFVIIATFMYATSVNILKRNLQEMNALTIAVGNFAVIIIPAFIILLFSDFFNLEYLSTSEVKVSLLYMVLLSLFGTAIAKVLFNKLVHVATPVFASSVTYLMPVIAVFWGVLDGESFSFIQGVASAIILLGVYLSHKRKS
ncbi:permease [Flavivirga aquatica]|uniref:Permease n=1 Tax=Flavivirga aquatica TaxID=1849968 RepID=A0A1E5TDL0_9FLAO|nr:EamA family transporter [Flavivirga aquatica]OEK09438.1 permease [Flavivirga aquatica]